MKEIKKIHFVGIKGVGVAPLAVIAKEAGFNVTGSDIADEFITDAMLVTAGIVALIGFDAQHSKGADLVIYTGAHGGFDNVEVQFAVQAGVETWSQGEAVGKFMAGDLFGKKFTGISVAGCHGKTTTSAMMATVLQIAGLDPTFAIGTSDIIPLGASGHFGAGTYFVAEADEYATDIKHDRKPKFLWQHPKIGIITNIEFDHPDIYKDLDAVREAYLEFANNISKDGVLIANSDDEQTQELLKSYKGKVITFGLEGNAEIVEKLKLNVFGQHNVMNALAVFAACSFLGLDKNQIFKGLAAFRGTKRRAEFKGTLESGAQLFDDYAHHPTEISATLSGFRKQFKDKKILCIFQPHMYSRTKMLYEEFVKAFGDADTIIITDIYPSLREAPDPSVSSEKLASSIKSVHKDCIYLSTLPDVVKYITDKKPHSDTVVITMGAGDVYKISDDLGLKI